MKKVKDIPNKYRYQSCNIALSRAGEYFARCLLVDEPKDWSALAEDAGRFAITGACYFPDAVYDKYWVDGLEDLIFYETKLAFKYLVETSNCRRFFKEYNKQ